MAEQAHQAVGNHQNALKNHKSEVSDLLDSHKADLRRALSSHENLTKEEVERLKAWINYFLATLDKQKSRENSLEADISSLRASFSELTHSSKNTINMLINENSGLKTHLETLSETLENLRSDLSATRDTLKNTQKSVVFLENSRESENSKPAAQPEPSQQIPITRAPDLAVSQNLGVSQPLMAFSQHSDFERHIIQRVMPNRRGYILKFIMDLVSENRYSTKEIEELVVKEKRLCGRTSFYAYLKELKFRGKISYANIDERAILVNTDKSTQKTLFPTKSED